MSQIGIYAPARLTDLGPVGDGVTGARWFADENGRTFVGKASIPQHKYVYLNEVIATKIAQCLGLRTPLFEVASYLGKPLFLSERLENSKQLRDFGARALDLRTLFGGCDDVINLVCFDYLVTNYDRHFGNIFCVDGGSHQLLYAFDHSDAVLGRVGYGRVRDVDVKACADYLHSHFQLTIGRLTNDPDDWHRGVDRIQALSDANIASCLDGKDLGLSKANQRKIADFIKRRRDAMKDCIDQVVARHCLSIGKKK